jgi:hypothetical protein
VPAGTPTQTPRQLTATPSMECSVSTHSILRGVSSLQLPLRDDRGYPTSPIQSPRKIVRQASAGVVRQTSTGVVRQTSAGVRTPQKGVRPSNRGSNFGVQPSVRTPERNRSSCYPTVEHSPRTSAIRKQKVIRGGQTQAERSQQREQVLSFFATGTE